jgi:hypothetical protein
MDQKSKPLRGRTSKLDRFNKDPQRSNFIKEFQEIMIQRLNLNYIDKYHKKNIAQIVRSTVNRPLNTINTRIKGGFTLSCNVEPELYIQIQETAKKITGDYVPIDELIHLLLTYFCDTYKGSLPKNQLPYKHVFKGRSFSKLLLFQKQFFPYYSNIVRNFME